MQHPMITAIEATGYPRGMEERVFTTCDWCGADIVVGEDYYNIHGEILCCKCVEDCREEAEI